jgi:GH25 family lysozyme M1 (1,4-beta-N-acetylmuramidase)
MRFRSSFPTAATFCLAAILAGCSSQSGEDSTGSSDDALTRVCGAQTNGPTQGRDVSVYQGAFNWAGANVDFGAARISDGVGNIDSQFDGNWARMKSSNTLRSAYQFFEPGESEVAQANLVISKVGKLGAGDLPVMLDIEVTGGQSPATIRAKAQHWLDLVEAGTGKRPFVYSYASFLQDNLGSGFGKYPLWIAGYGETCPSVPSGWTNWVVWQYSDGNGTLDHDVFNGTLAQLKANYAADPVKVEGYLDSATTSVAGWAADLNAPTHALSVDIYFGGAAGAGGYGVEVTANLSRPDVAKATGAGADHGYSLSTPLFYCDTHSHPVYAYAHQVSDGAAVELTDAPRNVTCDPEPSPAGLLRHIPSETELTAWAFDQHASQRWMTTADKATHMIGSDWPADPVLGRTASDGAIYLVDGTSKRHVQSAASLAAWKLTALKTVAWTDAEAATFADGAPLPLQPTLIQAVGDTAIYVLDADPPPVAVEADAGAGTPLDDDGGSDLGAVPASAGDVDAGADDVPSVPNGGDANAANGSSSGGCSAAPTSSHEGGAGFLLFGLVAGAIAVMRRRSAPKSKTVALVAVTALIAGCGSSGKEDTGDTDDELTRVCGASAGGPVQGVDVSYYQGAFNWAGAGVQFGAARISDGTGFVDPDFDGNWSRMKSAGVLRSAYQFFEPGENEVSQANLVISKVGRLGAGDLPVMLDIEVTGGQSPSTIRERAQHWLDLVEAGTGKKPFVYSYGSFLETNLGSGFGSYPLWIAAYGPSCPSVPAGWNNWVVWQYSDGGGHLDHDVFNGSEAQLKALAGDVAPPGPPTAKPAAPTGCGAIDPGHGLSQGESVKSCDGRFELVMQTDGNLVEYLLGSGGALWSTGTSGTDGFAAIMQGDGNFVLYGKNSNPLWDSHTNGHGGASLAVQSDGNLVVYDAGRALWNAGTEVIAAPTRPTGSGIIPAGQGLAASEGFSSPSGKYSLAMQSDGNLVLYHNGVGAIWTTATSGSEGYIAIMQGDGNFVLYDRHGKALWSSGTAGHLGAELAIQDDGNMVVYAGGVALWNTHTNGR